MVIALESPRWRDLRHAYGSAEDTPALIRKIREEVTPDYSDEGAWFEVYSSLFHQYSTYSATYAAIPHIVQIAVDGNVLQRAAVICLLGEINIAQRWVEARVAPDLVADFELSLDVTRGFSLATLREAVPLINTDASRWWTLGELLQGFGGLYFPKSGYVVQLRCMVGEEWQVQCDCPHCRGCMIAELRDDGICTMQIQGASVLPESAKCVAVDRSTYPDSIEKMASLPGAWTESVFPMILSSLADELGDSLLATRILDLGTVVRCPYCDATFTLSSGVTAL